MKKKKQSPFQKNKYEILYKIINGLIAGSLFFLGSITTTGEISLKAVALSFISSLVVFIMQFQEYWKNEEKEYCNKTKILNFVGV